MQAMQAGSLALDTTAVVLHLRGKSAVASQCLAAATEIYLPVTSLGELWYGVEHSTNPERARQPLEAFLTEAIIIYPDEETAKVYARLKQYLASRGTPIPDNDLWIAATASSHHLRLYHDDGHFEHLDGKIEHDRV
jgi:tRNA(fMet)-specific endonuclease VapC